MAARNGVWFLAVPAAFALVACLSVESLPPGEPTNLPRHIGRSSALAPFLRFARSGPNHAEPAVNLRIAATNAGPLVPITVSTLLPDARTFCVDVDLNHDGRFEGAGELAYATGQFDESGIGELRLHGLIDGRYRARVRVDGIHGETVSAIQKFELLPPRNSHLPISFEVNRGQTDSSVLFVGRAKNQMVFVTRNETVLVTTTRRAELRKEPVDSRPTNSTAQATQFATRFRLAGANSWAQPTGQKMLPGKANYFIGNDSAKWRTDIDTFAEITTDVYPGIRMIHRSSQGRLAYDFHVAPGANPADIALDFADAERLSLNDDGDLIVHHAAGNTIRHSAPVMYQESRGIKQAIKGDWVLKESKQAAFVVAAYDRGRELVIDPVIWATYLGGSGTEWANAVAVDGAGNIYVTGFTGSPNFPVQIPLDATLGGGTDIFVTKFNAAGTALVYSTYLGGSGGDVGNANSMGIALDVAGNVHVVGTSQSGDFPTVSAAQPALSGAENAVVIKVNPAGNALVFSTYLGGNTADQGYGIAVDSTNAVYVVGLTQGGFPVTAGALQTTYGGGYDGFLAKYTPAGVLAWATYLGGSGQDRAYGVAVRGSNAYVTGFTQSTDFATTPGVFQPANAGGQDVFVIQLNAAGTAAVYSTYIGGSSAENGYGIAVDSAGNAYIGGMTNSPNFPATPGVPQPAYGGGGNNGFICKLNPGGSALVYSTYLGKTFNDEVRAIAIDSIGNAYVTGYTNNGIPLVNQFQGFGGGGQPDAFVSVINAGGTAYLLSTPLGGPSAEFGYGIAVDAAKNIYIVGECDGPGGFPTLSPFQAIYGGGATDGFVVKLSLPPTPGVTITQSGGTTNVTEGGATDTYTVVLNTVPTMNVTITITPDTQVTVAPAVLTFTPANWNLAQSVKVTAVDDALVEGAHAGTITHMSASADAAYNAIVIASVTANITDNDGVPPPPPPPPPVAGGGIAEGNYSGSLGLGNGNGKEGTFGFGRHMVQQARLKGPYRDPAGTFRVFNVAHQQRGPAAEADSGLGIVGWSLILLAVFVPALVVYGRRRPG